MSLSVLCIEDEPLWRNLIETIVYGAEEGCHCRAVASAEAGWTAVRERTPDVVLLDVRLPDGSGIELAQRLADNARPPRIVFLSARRDPVVLRAAGQPHISGLIWKSAGVAEQLAQALRELREGKSYFPPEVRDAMRRLRTDPLAFFKILSGRELELLPLFGQGLTDAEIAARSTLSVFTVKSHRQHTMAKIGVHRTVELIHWAIANGFVEPPVAVAETAEIHRSH